MTRQLNTYSIRVKFQDELKYGQWITAPSLEEATNLFIEEYLDVRFVRMETKAPDLSEEILELNRQILELQAELATARAQHNYRRP